MKTNTKCSHWWRKYAIAVTFVIIVVVTVVYAKEVRQFSAAVLHGMWDAKTELFGFIFAAAAAILHSFTKRK